MTQQQPQDEAAAEGGSTNNNDNTPVRSEAEELAGMVWAFVNAAGGLVEGLDAEVSSLPSGSGRTALSLYRCFAMAPCFSALHAQANKQALTLLLGCLANPSHTGRT